MNSYGSSIRTLTARNVIEKTIAPPADMQVLVADPKPQIFEAGQRTTGSFRYISGSNLILERAGLFSNFGDGLVWKNPWVRATVNIEAVPFSLPASPISGTVSLALNSKAITGIGTVFTTEMIPGSVIKVQSGGRTGYFIVDTVTDNFNATLTDYGMTAAGVSCEVLNTPVPSILVARISGVENFNTMYEIEAFIPVAVLGGNLNNFFLKASVGLSSTADLMTRTIDTSYDGETAYFDVKADFKLTLTNI